MGLGLGLSHLLRAVRPRREGQQRQRRRRRGAALGGGGGPRGDGGTHGGAQQRRDVERLVRDRVRVGVGVRARVGV